MKNNINTVKNKTNKVPRIQVKWEDRTIHLENAFIGGRWVEENNDPIGFYGGQIDLGEMGISLMNLLRAAIRISGEECGLNLEKAEEFLIFCVAEAVKREEESAKEQRTEYIQKIVKRFMDNQN